MKNKPLFTTILLLLLLFLVLQPFSNSNADGALTGIKICLDPGHGGTDPGAVNSAFKLNESDINLDVSYGLKHLFEGAGAEAVLTRTGDEYLTNRDRYTYCNEQQATILISVHTNSVIYPDWDGSMALYAPSRDPYLAQAIYDKMYPFLLKRAPDGVDFRDFGLDNFASGVLFKCDMPAAMMEPLFMSHPAEAELLGTPIFTDSGPDFSSRRGQIAMGIYLGALNYFDSQSPDSMHVAAIDMNYEQKRVMYTVNSAVTIHDSTNDPAAGAEVAIEFTQPDGSSDMFTAVTGADGAAIFKIRSKATGTYELTVAGVSKSGWEYDSAANDESSATLIVP